VDLSLDNRLTIIRKCLIERDVIAIAVRAEKLLMDVNKPGELRDSFAWA
jgi:hypothetical protein